MQLALTLQHAGELSQIGFDPVLLAIYSRSRASCGNHRVDVVLQLGHFATSLNLDRARQIALGDGRCYFSDRSHLRREVRGQQVHVTREILPGTSGAGDVRLASEPTVDSDLACHVGHLIGKGRERDRHIVDRVGEGGDFTFGLNSQTLGEIAIGHRGHYFDDAAHLLGEVRGHEVDVVGEILPCTAYAGNHSLTT